ncbi:hypothetical protein [Umezawaea sp. Da 62-37]|uniref:hypothetical protein n=1 Tax=Umezawaea sp. Da 62-37 TaxID=3075927 RepID=UPI0028F6D90C|nr:hypothetical protein [Umezawaea sp. Da 62-37]WNV83000.1 hypothetical protein RM788_33060 [Umezawaea sp. Da 62-37]
MPLTHERAHTASRYRPLLVTATLAATVDPLHRPLHTAVACTVKRWADQSTAERVGDRRSTARAVGKAALAIRRITTGHPAALHALGGSRASPGVHVADRPAHGSGLAIPRHAAGPDGC